MLYIVDSRKKNLIQIRNIVSQAMQLFITILLIQINIDRESGTR